MTYYLQMDGVDDWLGIDLTMNITRIEIDCYITSNATSSSKYLLDNGFSWVDVKNGVITLNNFGTFTGQLNVRHIAELTYGATPRNPSKSTFFAANSRTANFLSGKLYSIKFYNGASLVAHYDMSTGTVQDQSGNGRHATLTGGTWVQDGGGGTTHTLASSANGVSVATTSLTVVPAAIQLAASAVGVGQGTANLSVLNASMLLSANAPGVSQGSASMSVILGLASDKSGVAWGSASLAGLTVQLSASANGVAVGYASLISGVNIVGFIRLEGKQVISIHLVGKRDLHATLGGSMNPPSVALGGVI